MRNKNASIQVINTIILIMFIVIILTNSTLLLITMPLQKEGLF